MKKTLIATAVAAGMLATGAAQADPTVYGLLHLSIDTFSDHHIDDSGTTPVTIKSDAPTMNSNTSAIGVKGSEDLGGGLKAIYKAEFKVDPFNGNEALERRDIWLGLKGGWGKVAVGTMSSNYKQMGGKIDPLYRTVAEGRGILNMQSGFHGGAGTTGQGRMEKALQYTTPKMAGIEIVINTTVSGVDNSTCTSTIGQCDETLGAGIRWSNKNWLVFADYLDPTSAGTGPVNNPQASDESIAKIGGMWSNKAFQVGAQYEMAEDQTGGDYMFLNGLWNINAKNTVTVSWGQQDKVSDAYALAYVFSMSKQTNVYAAWGNVEADSCTGTGTAKTCSYDTGVDKDGVAHDGGSVLSLGIRKSF